MMWIQKKGSLFRLGVIGLLLGSVLFSQMALAQSVKGPYRKLDVFARVLSLIEQNHVESIDEGKLIEGAIQGMLRALDPHSSYLSPEDFRILKEDTEGNFCGVGMEVGIKEGELTVITPIPDSPAIKAGILPGDRILKIEGVPTSTIDLMDAVQRMRGREGTDVTITVKRESEEPFEVVLTRAVIEVQSVAAELLEPGYAHIRIKAFQEETSAQVRDELRHMKLIGGGLKGVVLDLRRNPGGLMYEAVKVSDLFVSEGMLLSTKSRGGVVIESFDAHRAGTFDDIELVVLIDGASASAAEIVAGALQDSGRAMVVGMQSFGKGSVQTIIPLRDGAALKLTTSRYYTPAGRSIQAEGIMPDVVVESLNPPVPDEMTQAISEMPTEGELPGHLQQEKKSNTEAKSPELSDYQLRMGFQILKGMVRSRAAREGK
ncbi:MAG: S41 family peptidase [Deltaproteobacteria bacterium]|nr:S41 family peptidase [Deltaproteobacteria bacterium]